MRTNETVLAVGAALAVVLEVHDPSSHVTARGVTAGYVDEALNNGGVSYHSIHTKTKGIYGRGAVHHGRSVATVVDDAVEEAINTDFEHKSEAVLTKLSVQQTRCRRGRRRWQWPRCGRTCFLCLVWKSAARSC